MSSVLLVALVNLDSASKKGIKNAFSFQYRLCHDSESPIWVIVYAMMVLDCRWRVHSYIHLWNNRSIMMSTVCSVLYQTAETEWFPDPHSRPHFSVTPSPSPWISAGR